MWQIHIKAAPNLVEGEVLGGRGGIEGATAVDQLQGCPHGQGSVLCLHGKGGSLGQALAGLGDGP